VDRLPNNEKIPMSNILNEVLSANKSYASAFGDKGELPLPPARHFAILTCMDARLDPSKFAGLAEGDAHVIRNADDWSSGCGRIAQSIDQESREIISKVTN